MAFINFTKYFTNQKCRYIKKIVLVIEGKHHFAIIDFARPTDTDARSLGFSPGHSIKDVKRTPHE